MPPQEKRLKFVEGERVLCFHGPLLYEAVIKGQLRDKVTKYLIHYNGWNKNWDEWVTESRVMKYCEENLKKQKELKQQHVLVSLFRSARIDIGHRHLCQEIIYGIIIEVLDFKALEALHTLAYTKMQGSCAP